jgi:RNA polymerase sigma-70 factor (ECF subfamily)
MDSKLVIQAQQGDKEAFTRLAGALTASLLSVAHRILRDGHLAEDATQQALLNMWQRLPQLRDPDRFEAWSYRLLVRACFTEGRRSRRWSPGLALLPEREPETVDVAGAVIDRDQLERAFRRLSLDHRAVVVLRHYRHMSLDEVSAALNVPVGTVASRLHYALRELRSALEADARPGAGKAVS